MNGIANRIANVQIGFFSRLQQSRMSRCIPTEKYHSKANNKPIINITHMWQEFHKTILTVSNWFTHTHKQCSIRLGKIEKIEPFIAFPLFLLFIYFLCTSVVFPAVAFDIDYQLSGYANYCRLHVTIFYVSFPFIGHSHSFSVHLFALNHRCIVFLFSFFSSRSSTINRLLSQVLNRVF